jgi:hypothetical protein
MATTTNYNWSTPDDTSLVKDGAAAIRTLGSSIDTTTKALNPSTTLGDIEYRSSTANTNTRLGIGSTGQILTVAGGVPTWASAGPSGKVLQVLQTIKTDTFTSTSNSFTDITGLSVSITPSSASSKILVFYSVVGASSATTSDSIASIRLMRDATAIAIGDAANNRQRSTGSISTRETNATTINFTSAGQFLDTPSSTSALTYKVQGITGAGTFYINRTQGDADAASSYRTVSTITVMEIGA